MLSLVEVLYGVEVLREFAFANCPQIANISLPNSITTLSGGVFYQDSGLTSVKLSRSIRSFGNIDFNGCTALAELIIGDSLESVGHQIISGTKIERIDFPASFKQFNPMALDGATNLKFVGVHPDSPYFSNDERGVLYDKEKTSIVFTPITVDSIAIPGTVIEIRKHGIYGCNKITSFEIPDHIHSLGPQSIYLLPKLTTITIGSGLRIIPSNSIGGFGSLTTIIFKEGVEKICKDGITSSSNVRSIRFSKTVLHIESGAFPSGLPLTSIVVEEGNEALELEEGVLYQKTNGTRTSIPLVLYNATSVKIGMNITEVSVPGINVNGLTRIEVEEGNEAYSSYKDILYNKYRTVVLLIPQKIESIELHPDTKNISASSGRKCGAVNITLNEGLDYIDNYSFAFSSIASLAVPQSVKYIGYSSFNGCRLKSVVIHCLSLEILDLAFMDCKNLKTFEFSKECNISKLSYALFYRSGIETIKVPKSVKSIEIQCFDSSSLSSITIPEGSQLSVIYEKAFLNTKLTLIEFPKGINLRKISQEAFKGTRLETVSFPDFLEEIQTSSFEIKTLKAIKFSKDSRIKKIQSKAFYGTSITALHLPPSIEVVGESSFSGCLDLKEVEIESRNRLETLDPYSFSGCINLKTVKLGKGGLLKELKPAICSQCRSLQYFELPDSIEEIHSQTFFQCERLIEIEISENSNLTEFGEMSFDGCHSLGSIFVPRKVKAIRNRSFNGCENLTSLLFDENITDFIIETNAFFGCSHLPEVNFARGLRELGPKSFETCRSLSVITFARGCRLERVRENTFFGCSHLSGLLLPSGVGVVEKGSFNGCSELKWVGFERENSLREVGERVFAGCELLEGVDFGESSRLERIGASAFEGCRSLSEVHLPSSVEAIAAGAFESCAKLERVTLGRGSLLGSIRERTFRGCKRLREIVVPSKVRVIEASAFEECSSLESVIFEGGRESQLQKISTKSFLNCGKLFTLQLPATVGEIEPESLLGCVSLQNISIEAEEENKSDQRKCQFSVSKDGRSILSGDRRVLIACPSAEGQYPIEETIQEISTSAFKQTSIVSINLSEIVCIGDKAFEDTPIKEITIGKVKTVGERSFANCPNLIVNPTTNPKFIRIGKEAFFNSPKVFSRITFDESLEHIGNKAFFGVKELKEIVYCGQERFDILDKCPNDVFTKAEGNGMRVNEEAGFENKAIVSEDYEGNAFCGIRIKRVEGNPCIAATIDKDKFDLNENKLNSSIALISLIEDEEDRGYDNA